MLMTSKIWKIQNHESTYTDEELIAMIQNGVIKGDDYITNRDLKKWMKVKETIYQFYLKEVSDEKEQD